VTSPSSFVIDATRSEVEIQGQMREAVLPRLMPKSS